MRTVDHTRRALLAATLLAGCGDPGGGTLGYRSQALAVPTTITFDEMNLPAGTVLAGQLGAFGLVFAGDANTVERIGDAGGSGAWPTPSGARYLAVNTVFGAQSEAVLVATFVERLTGAPSAADHVDLWIVDPDALPPPHVTVTALDGNGVELETVETAAETEHVVLQSPGIAALRFTDRGGDGFLVDDLTFTLQDDLDGDGVPNSLDHCPATPAGPPIDAVGCSCGQRVVLACPPGDPWGNHGAYVSCVAHAANACVAEGILTGQQHGEVVSTAARSPIGKKK